MNQYFHIDKTTNTPADTLLAFGLAKLLSRLLDEDGSQSLQINDLGDCYQIVVSPELADEKITRSPYFHLFDGLDTATQHPDLPAAQRVDYLGHQQENRDYFEARKSGMKDEQLHEAGLHPPLPDWPAWAAVNQMSAIAAYNGLAQTWNEHRECFPDLLKIILAAVQSRPNAFDEAEEAWKVMAKDQKISTPAQIPQLQVINPGMGKGGNSKKAVWRPPGGLKGFWIVEYLKFAGMFEAALPRTVKGVKDRKTYILRPKALRWDTHRTIFPRFQESLFATTAVQMDIMATLRYCQVFLEQWKVGQDSSGWGKFARARPGDHVAALDMVYYKHLGSAHATMNMSTLVLPEWLPEVSTSEQADQFLAMLTEHMGIVRNLEERIGSEYELLRNYRDFLSARDLRSFYDFNRRYSKYIMHKLVPGARFYPRQFTLVNLEVLLMAHNSKLEPILHNEGFLHIAAGIRRSTVIPQYQKARGSDSLYEIRYGLGDQLLRHAQYPDDFIQELSRFIHDYNRENARKSETRKKQFRTNITTNDLAAIVSLIDEYGAPTIANLLVAYGYARDPKVASPEAETTDHEETPIESDDSAIDDETSDEE